ncbi:MAG TPA: flagellar export protein FliJ [Burkholderiales bacterium]|nr:flagellar export protein FliJ [Burkholderiales bacterium]
MKQTFRLKVVHDLAQQQSDTAATRLGVLNANAGKSDQKLNMLLEYREEYRERFRSRMNGGLDTAGLSNFRQFMEKLDEAIDQQRAACNASRDAVARGQSEWQAKQINVKAYDTLAQRHQSAQLEHMKKLDQRVTDEFAARAHHQKG